MNAFGLRHDIERFAGSCGNATKSGDVELIFSSTVAGLAANVLAL